MDAKHILYLLRKSPYSNSNAVEALDSALVAGVFEQNVSVLFKDDGVWQLLDGQRGAAIERRTIGNVMQALPQYDIEQLFACEASLAERGLQLEDLALTVKPLSLDEQRKLIARQDAVVND